MKAIIVRFRCFAVILFAVIMTSRLYPQQKEVSLQRLSVEEGLSNSTVTCIVQDKFGFMWIGTEDGLNKYDGYSFTVFKHNEKDSSSISSSSIGMIAVDSAGDVWSCFEDVLDRYDQLTGKFIHYRLPPPPGSSLRSNIIGSIAIDAKNDVWLASSGGGLLAFHPQSSSYDRIVHHPGAVDGLASDSLLHIRIDGIDRVWISYAGHGFSIYDKRHNVFETYGRGGRDDGDIGRYAVSAFSRSADGGALISFYQRGYCKFNEASRHFTYVSQEPGSANTLAENTIFTIMGDRGGKVWIGTFASGIDLYDPRRSRINHYPPNPGSSNALSSPRVYSLYEDRSGAVWIGTFKGGAYVYDPKRTKFARLSHTPGIQNSLNDNNVQAIYEDHQGILWIGTELGGLDRFDPVSEKFTHYIHDARTPASLQHNSVIAICGDSRERLWVGTYGGGLERFEPGKNSFVHYRHDRNNIHSLAYDVVKVLSVDSDGILWIGFGAKALDRFDEATNSFVHYQFGDSSSVNATEVQGIAQDHYGNIWIATFQDGVYRLNKRTGAFTHYLHDAGGRTSMSKSSLYCVAADGEYNVWFGTFGSGLDRYDEATDSFENFSETDGLPSNFVKGIVPDDRGNLWLSTSKGLSRFTPKTKSFRNYDVTDGVQANEFRTGSYHKGRSGKLYFGGPNGLNSFSPDEVLDNPVVPEVLLTGFKVFDKPLKLPQSPLFTGHIELSYTQDYFAFEFVGLNYTVPEKNKYAYMLEGFDKDWIMCGTRRYASYTHLNGGTYEFKVKACNNDGIWNEGGRSVTLVIYPPFWERWWFRGGMVLMIAGIPFMIYRSRFNRLLEIERTRSRIARDLHDELSATLSGINFFAQAITKDKENKISSNSGNFLSLIHESTSSLQESISDIIWSVNPSQDRWDQILVKFRRYASDLLDSKSIRYEFHLPENVQARSLAMERRRNLWLIYKEIITNTVKHSQCKNVSVTLAIPPQGNAELTIREDGRGFDPNIESSGNGLKNIRSRAQMLGGSIDIQSKPGAGTRWRLMFPLS